MKHSGIIINSGVPSSIPSIRAWIRIAVALTVAWLQLAMPLFAQPIAEPTPSAEIPPPPEKKERDPQIDLEGILDEVVVTGTGTQHFSTIAPVRTEILGRNEIELTAPIDLVELLTTLSPSFDAVHSSMGSGLTLGGLGNKYILVLVNGQRLHGSVGGQNDLSKIDPTSIQKVEIVKGATSTLYGSDAIAGVINIIIKKPAKETFALKNSSRYGSFNTWQQSNTLTFNQGAWSSTTRYMGQGSDGWQNSTQEIYRNKLYEDSTTPTVSAYYNHTLSEELTYKPSDLWSVTASGLWYKKRIFHHNGAPRYRMYHLRYQDQSARIAGIYTPRAGAKYQADLSFDRHAYYYDYHIRYMYEEMEQQLLDDGRMHYVPRQFFYYPGDSSLESDDRRWILSGKAIYTLGEQHLLSVGTEAIIDQLYAPKRMASASRTAFSIAGYAQDEWQVSPQWNLTYGGRLLYHEAFGLCFTPKVSFHYNMEEQLQLRGGYAMGYKTPSIKELYYEYERTMMGKLRVYLGNPKLKPEMSHFFSLSASYKPQRTLTLDVGASFNMLRDVIVLVPSALPSKYVTDEGSDFDTGMQYTNGEWARAGEVEASLLWRPTPAWRLSLGYSYSHTWASIYNDKESKRQKKTILDERPLDGTAPHKATAMLSWNKRWNKYHLSVGLSGRAQSDRYYYSYGTAPGYMLLNLTSHHKWNLPKGLQADLALGINNLLDYKETHPYGMNFGTKTAGRTFYATVSLSWEYKKQR